MSALPPIATAKADICPRACPLYPRKRHRLRFWHIRLGPEETSGLSFNHLFRANENKRQFDLNARAATSKKILRHIVNCEIQRHDYAYSIAGGDDDHHSRTGIGSFGGSPRNPHGSPV